MKGTIRVKGHAQARFWIRVLKLEEELERVRSLLDQDAPPGNFATVPIVAEYAVDDSLKFYYFIVFHLDRLGADEAFGIVYLGDKENWEEIARDRDKVADETLAHMEAHRPFDEARVIQEGKED